MQSKNWTKKKIKKKLILSATDINNYQNKSGKILFLNNWYFLQYKELVEKKKLKVEILDHYNKTAEAYSKHLSICENIYNSIIQDFSKEFNSFHKTNYSFESCVLILGPWLRQFIHICYDRYMLMKNFFKNFENKNLFLFNPSKVNLFTEDCQNIYNCSTDEKWNLILISKIIFFFKFTNKYKLNYKIKNNHQFFKNKVLSKKNKVIIFLKKILDLINYFNKRLNNYSIIHESYLPLWIEKKLEILCGQIPNIWNFDYQIKKKANFKLRKKLNFKYNTKNNIENFIRSILPLSIPISLLENFDELRKQTLKFPQNPKFIFSSNSYMLNTLFKIYSAEQKEKKTKIYYGQHGNGSFLNPESFFRSDYNFCDKYFTWGFKSKKKDLPLFNFKSSFRSKKFNSKGNMNIISRSLGNNSNLFDRQLENLNILDFLKFLPLNLNSEILQNSVLRLHLSNIEKNNHHQYLKKEFNLLKNYNKNFYEGGYYTFLRKGRLTLFLYNATGILENLSLNMPTVCYWREGFNQINQKFHNRFKMLMEAKVFFLDPNELVAHINKVWYDIDSWWFKTKTQDLINKFNKNLNENSSEKKFKLLISTLIK